MAKDSIRKMLEDSKRELDAQQDGFAKAVGGDLASFKKKALDGIR